MEGGGECVEYVIGVVCKMLGRRMGDLSCRVKDYQTMM